MANIKEKYIAPTTTFDYVEGEGMLLNNVSTELPETPGEPGDNQDFSRQESGFEDSSFDFGSWDN